MRADDLIRELGLQPHPEGGFYAETFRSPARVTSATHHGTRAASTAIYFLLRSGEFSAFHRIASDEVWHHHRGDGIELHSLAEDGCHAVARLGADIRAGERPQVVIPVGTWQAARTLPGPAGYALAGCSVAPGFEFRDFELPGRVALIARFPQHAALIRSLTR